MTDFDPTTVNLLNETATAARQARAALNNLIEDAQVLLKGLDDSLLRHERVSRAAGDADIALGILASSGRTADSDPTLKGQWAAVLGGQHWADVLRAKEI